MKLLKLQQKMPKLFLSWISLLVIFLVPKINLGKSVLEINYLEDVQISIITCDPGEEIYSLFGHSALRINHQKGKQDIVVNWGIFEYDENQLSFGYNFAKGRLNYYMGIQNTSDFLKEYFYFQRGVREQLLNLSALEKEEILKFVDENYKPENRNYKYEFFFDNCSTRIRELLKTIFKSELKWGSHSLENKKTFRDLIHQNLVSQPWLMLGIDLVLGKRIDQNVSNENLMFLPEYLESIIDSTTISSNQITKNIVAKKTVLITSKNKSKTTTKSVSLYGWIILVVTILGLFLQQEKIVNSWAALLLSLTGVLGIVLSFMWIGTDHQATKENLNILWANPFHLYVVWVIISKKWNKFSLVYIIIFGFILLATILFWFGMVQDFNDTIKPIIISLALIFFYYYRKNKIVIYNANK